MLTAAAQKLIFSLGLTEEVDKIQGTGPNSGTKDVRWITKEDLLQYACSMDRPLSHVHLGMNTDGSRLAVWHYARDPMYRCQAHAYAACRPYELRPYQREAVRSCVNDDAIQSCIIEMTCAGGKTFVGSHIAALLQTHCVVITTHRVSVEQWHAHFVSMGLDPRHVCKLGEPFPLAIGDCLPPILIGTYALLSQSCLNKGSKLHATCLGLKACDHLLILDEVHTAAAKTYQQVFALRSKCIVGLTATLCREDDGISCLHEFIGPALCTTSAESLRRDGYVAHMRHVKILIPLSAEARRCSEEHSSASVRQQISILNPNKVGVLLALIRKHAYDHILVFCDRLDCIQEILSIVQMEGIRAIGPVTGDTSKEDRLAFFEHFEKATTACLFLSRVGDNAVSLNVANVIIKLSTTSRSRNQEEQRNGRGSRKHDVTPTILYTLITQGTQEEIFFLHRDHHLQQRGFELECVDVRMESASALGLAWQREDVDLSKRLRVTGTDKRKRYR